jgi:hypothetical protein
MLVPSGNRGQFTWKPPSSHFIERHYDGSHQQINPTGIVPKGPALDFTEPHGRERLCASR